MKYTVLLLYPDYVQDGGEGAETYLAYVEAADAPTAQFLAQNLARLANAETIESIDDFRVLAVFEGHLNDRKVV